jgi:hypothetical protein
VVSVAFAADLQQGAQKEGELQTEQVQNAARNRPEVR